MQTKFDASAYWIVLALRWKARKENWNSGRVGETREYVVYRRCYKRVTPRCDSFPKPDIATSSSPPQHRLRGATQAGGEGKKTHGQRRQISLLLLRAWYATSNWPTHSSSFASGYGHATRVSAFASSLLSLEMKPDVYVVSSASPDVFSECISCGAHYRHADVDPIIVQPLA